MATPESQTTRPQIEQFLATHGVPPDRYTVRLPLWRRRSLVVKGRDGAKYTVQLADEAFADMLYDHLTRNGARVVDWSQSVIAICSAMVHFLIVIALLGYHLQYLHWSEPGRIDQAPYESAAGIVFMVLTFPLGWLGMGAAYVLQEVNPALVLLYLVCLLINSVLWGYCAGKAYQTIRWGAPAWMSD